MNTDTFSCFYYPRYWLKLVFDPIKNNLVEIYLICRNWTEHLCEGCCIHSNDKNY